MTVKAELPEVRARLAELLGLGVSDIRTEEVGESPGPDLTLLADNSLFIVEVKHGTSAASISGGIEQLTRYRTMADTGAILLLVVPFMAPTMAELASKRGVSWMDLSGNANIRTPKHYIHIQGRPNRYPQRGRPSTPFAPKASRIVRWFLMNPGESTTQQDLASSMKIDPGQVSRTVSYLLNDRLLRRTVAGELMAPNLDLLLDAWRGEYDFRRHGIEAGHIPGRSGVDTMNRVVEALKHEKVRYAVSGLAGAWQWTQFASFRLVTVLVESTIQDVLLEDVGFRRDAEGANVWLVTPNDEGTFFGSKEVDGIFCAHPVQVYLDLSGHPERASEAAEELRGRLLDWTDHA